MSLLFNEFKLRGVTFSNRIWVSPMCQYSAKNGLVGDWHKIHLGALVSGLPGLVMVEATGIVPDGRISIGCLSIEDDEHATAFKPIIEFAHSHRVKIGIQLAHAGRKGSTMRPGDDHKIALLNEGGWKTVSASPLAFADYPIPNELTVSEIKNLINEFSHAAKRAIKSGFDVIEIHAAHGYLLHQFYSPLSNHRNDEYGGDFTGRTKFLLETVRSVRKCIPAATPLFVRISATDWIDGGWDINESTELCILLKESGVDLVDVSSGGNLSNADIPNYPGYQVSLAKEIRMTAKIPTSAVGLITDPLQAEKILVNEDADAIFLGREMLRNPRWPLYAAKQLGVDIDWPIQLQRGKIT